MEGMMKTLTIGAKYLNKPLMQMAGLPEIMIQGK